MSSFDIHGLLGLFRLFTSTLVAGWMSSPMSWSPDAQWLSYTVAPGSEHDGRAPGWLFDASSDRSTGRDARIPGEPKSPSSSTVYQIWATQRDAERSVLIEESAWPLTAPSWSPLARSVAFGRFVPESMEPHQPAPRGRLEVVIQNGLDRKRVVLTVPEFELDAEARADFPHVSAAWSPDGQYLAFPRPGRPRAILIIKTDSRRLLQVLDHAVLPAWSLDGSKLAFIRVEDPHGSLQLVERRGQTFLAARPVHAVGRVAAAPFWSGDGRSLVAVVEKTGARSQELELARVVLETGEVTRILSLAPEILRRGAEIRGVAIDFDRDDERCFFAVDFAGRDTELVWSYPRDRSFYKRFHPLDVSLRIGSLTLSPDGRAVALRFGTPGALTLPAIYDLASDQTSLVIPDEAARQAWLAVLAGTARTLLLAGLPAAAVGGQVADRPTILPLPGEIPAQHPVHARLGRLGRFGSALCDLPRRREAAEGGEEQDGPTTAPEDRLFFNYIRADFASAAADLEALEPRITSPDHRLALLSLRAQILWSQGESTRARAIVAYLLSTGGGPTRRVEETPLGLSLTTDPDPRQTWAHYLSARTTEGAPPPAPPQGDPPGERMDLHLLNPFVAPEAPAFERGGGVRAIPFAPIRPGRDPRLIRPGIAEPVRPPVLPPPPPRPIDPPRRFRLR